MTTKMLRELVLKNRSYRKFYADKSVGPDTLTNLIDLARNTPSSKNFQPLKYILVDSKEENDIVFSCLGWAKHLKDWDGPAVSERPPAYIIQLLDTNLSQQADVDAGISAQTILLGAVERGLGGCIIRTVDREKLKTYYQLPENLQILQVIAIGVPKQEVKLVALPASGQSNYYEIEGIHHVPKRSLKEIIFEPKK
jgi:nitroreductase